MEPGIAREALSMINHWDDTSDEEDEEECRVCRGPVEEG